MTAYELFDKEKISSLFAGWQEALLWSCLQGCMGRAFADDPVHPRAAQIVVGDFCFLAGEATEALVRNRRGGAHPDFCIMVPRQEAWGPLIESVYGGKAAQRLRYAIRKEGDRFDRERLRRMASQTPPGVSLHPIDRERYHEVMRSEWSRDFCSLFQNDEDFLARGIGFVAMEQGQIVSGASSYAVYRGGIEIEVDTKREYRRRGLAAACCARLILACLDRGWYPSWDAHNLASVALAEKLGYRFERSYPVFEIAGL